MAYRELASLQHYLLVTQARRRVEVYSREGEDWKLRIAEPLDAIPLPVLGVDLAFDQIYQDSGI